MTDRRSVTSVAGAGFLALALLFAVFAQQRSGPELVPRSIAASAQIATTPTIASIDEIVVVTPTLGSIEEVVVQPTAAPPTATAVPTAVPPTATAEPTAVPPTATAEPTPVETAEPEKPTMLDDASPVAAGIESLDELLDTETGIFGVMVLDSDGDLRYSRNADNPFFSASLYKLILVADILGRIERGEVLIDQEIFLAPEYFPIDPTLPDGYYTSTDMGATATVQEALWAAICVSSNVAALSLLTLTTTEDLNALTQDLGLQDTRYESQLADLPDWATAESAGGLPDQYSQAVSLIETEALEWKVNLTTPANMALFFAMLLDGEVVSGVVSNQLLELLFDQQMINRIPALLPKDTKVAHKTGNLDHIVHDVGVIMTADGPVILVAMSEAVPDEDHAAEIIQKIAEVVYQALAGPSAFR